MLTIEFNKYNLPPFRTYNYAIRTDNNSRKVKFVVYKEQDIDLTTLAPYIKLDNIDKSFADKVRLEEVINDDTIELTWTILRVQSKYHHLNTQIQFEDVDNDIVFQLPIIEFNIEKSIYADEEVENLYPSVIQDLQKQINNIHGADFYNTIYDFPSVGEDGKLYVSREDNSIYRFDSSTYTYNCVGRDWQEIEAVIDILD